MAPCATILRATSGSNRHSHSVFDGWPTSGLCFCSAHTIRRHRYSTLGPTLGSGPGRDMGVMLMVISLLPMIWDLLAFLYRPLREMETNIPDAQMHAIIYDDKDILQQEADKLLIPSAKTRI
jgi:hypothetical protein